eukprot:14436012-Ditylum_brightwellii.AAC.1
MQVCHIPCSTSHLTDGKPRSSKSADKTRDLEMLLEAHIIDSDDSGSDLLDNSFASSLSKESSSDQDSTFLSLIALYYKYPGQEEIIDQLATTSHPHTILASTYQCWQSLNRQQNESEHTPA